MPICRLCDEIEEKQFIRASHVFGGEHEHNFWQCRTCDAIYLNPTLSLEDEKRFYVQEFEGFMSSRVGDHRDWSNADRHKKTNQDQVYRRLPFFRDYLKEGVDLLEIGCSSGFMLDAFSEMGVHCTGVEPSGEFSEYLEGNGYQVYEDINEITNKKFDVVTHFFVFEHIADPYSFLAKNFELLKDGGVIVAEIPCALDPLTSVYNIEPFEKFYWSIAHHYYYTLRSLSFVLDKLGYRYEIVPEQRYDLSNHMVWMQEGRPGGQGRYTDLLGDELLAQYKNRLMEQWACDTMFLYIWK